MTIQAQIPLPRSRRRGWRWALRLLLFVLLGLGGLASPLACTTTVSPPERPDDPVTVYLLDHDYTSSLVLPAEDGGMVRYAYGDWNFYALGNRGFADGVAALCWPTQAALGRRELDGPATVENVRKRVGVLTEQLHAFTVRREAVERLRVRLDRLYTSRLDVRVENPGNELTFVPHPDSYSYFHNSNHVVAGWLSEIGCAVRGPAFMSRWEIAKPQAAP